MLGHAMLMAAGGNVNTSSDLYQAAQLADSPISLWPLSANANDIVGLNSFTGAAPSFSTSPLYTGGAGYAVFTGSQNLQTAQAPFALQAFSIEFVIRVNTGANLVILENNQNSGFSVLTNPLSSSNNIAMNVGASNTALASTGALPDAPQHIVLLYNSSGIGSTGYNEQTYVNGSLVSSTNPPKAPVFSSSSYLNLGSRNGSVGTPMSMAGLAFYAGNLSPERIAAHAAAAGF